ncbi:hypothetical protein [Gilliamella sp. wkB112]|uniref:hypothetical protein n=1 Tax=Gilliamella sp. wkB112 TaxID=3120257 RepID=UPI00080DC85D|nr:hypothetical protein [Gilliamella apicola]OCG00802.1 hypothetical protein A9G12_03290 [Gilliamella apicola]
MIKNSIKVLSVFLLLAIPAISFAQIKTFVEQHYGDGEIEGLAYINNKAKQFISEYNQQHQTNLQSLELNAKVFVPKCAVPLKAKWKKIKLLDDKIYHEYVIAVYCEKTRDSNQDKWDVWVPVSDEHNKLTTSHK